MFQKLIIATILIAQLSNAYCQIIQTDKGLIISREFAEFIAARFDSLKAYKLYFDNCINTLDSCSALLGKTEQLNILQELKIVGQAEEIAAFGQLIESYKRVEIVTTDIQKQLKKETRRRKFWQVIGIGSGAGLLTTILIIAL